MKKIITLVIVAFLVPAISNAGTPESCTKTINIMLDAFELGAKYNKEKGSKVIEQLNAYRRSHSECDTLDYLKTKVGGQ